MAVTLAACISSAPATKASTATRPQVTSAPFGTLADGTAIERFTMTNAHGITVQAMTFGAVVTSIRTPDRAGHVDDIVLGYDDLAGYVSDAPYFGAVVGRYANRIANARFPLDGQTYTLAANNGPNALHGGRRGFNKVVWQGASFERGDTVGVTFRRTSPAGEEGYPGTLQASVTYLLTARDELVVRYEATTDRATPINLTQHSYFNLHGGGRGTVVDHVLTLHASAFTPVDSTLIPTGEVRPVTGTPFDFTTPTVIGARIDGADRQLRYGRGYDHNWVLDRAGGTARVPAAHVVDSTTGRTLDVATTEPGIQFYTGNVLDGTVRGKGGQTYARRGALALETQHFPDSPNHPAFPSTILRPGATFRSETAFTFGTTR